MIVKPFMDLHFDDLLFSIAVNWILNKDQRARFSLLGIRYQDWPEIEERDWVARFEKGDRAEKSKIEFWASSAVDQGRVKEVTNDDMELMATYHSNIKRVRLVELARQIMSNPKEGEAAISRYLSDQAVRVTTTTAGNAARLSQGLVLGSFLDDGAWSVSPTFETLSKLIGGFQAGRVMLLSAKTGLGKTTLCLNLAISLAERMRVVFINMEMPTGDIGSRIVTIKSGVDSQDYHSARVNQAIVDRAIDSVDRLDLEITDGSSLTLDQIASLMISKKTDKPMLVVIDYDQKIATNNRQDEWRALNDAIQKIEETAKQVKCYVVVSSQADDNGDPRASKRMKQSASTVIYFNQLEDGRYVLEIRKNRFGPNNKAIELEYHPASGQIKEIGYVNTRPVAVKKRNTRPIQGVDN